MPSKKVPTVGQAYDLKMLAIQITLQLPKDHVRALAVLDYCRWIVENYLDSVEADSVRAVPSVEFHVVR